MVGANATPTGLRLSRDGRESEENNKQQGDGGL
jgi:hypothetical protein